MQQLRFAAALCLLAGGCQFSVNGDHVAIGSGDDAAVPNDGDGFVPTPADDLATAPAADLATVGPAIDFALAVPADMAMPLDMATPLDLTPVVVPSLVGNRVPGPSTVNLTTEGTSDWIHLGLNTATDVDRKNGGGSKIMVTPSAGLTQYGGYTTFFSWSDGVPTASASNTPTGVYELNSGSFTITAPAGTTQHTLRLYLNVGGTASLRARLSDASAPDYTDTLMSPANGSTSLYTLVYTSASASANLTVTWTLTNGTGISFLSATLQ